MQVIKDVYRRLLYGGASLVAMILGLEIYDALSATTETSAIQL